jgi:tRNA(Met) cytidine acetyltransferase
MPNHNFPLWLEQLRNQALNSFQRQLILLVGDVHWVKQLLQLDASPQNVSSVNASSVNVSTHSNGTWLIYSHHDDLISTIDKKHFAQQLGSEHHKILFSCFDNGESSADTSINLDAFAALSGTLVAGGVMLLWLEKPLEQAIAQTNKLSLKYFYQQLLKNKELTIINQDDKPCLPIVESTSNTSLAKSNNFLFQCKTKEQQTAVEHIVKVSKGHRNRPLVLTADRGRGKSSALAIACVQLLENNNALGHEKLNIVVTAPHVRCLSVFYRQVASSFAALSVKIEFVNSKNTMIKHMFGSISFVAVDQLTHLDDSTNVSLLLVDEAAAIPVHLLTQLASRFSRVVFSSTVHGYEGAGRGFTVKFQQKLSQLVSQWRGFHIHEPIRWRDKDPLESFVFDSCLLNAKLAKVSALNDVAKQQIARQSLRFTRISASSLINDIPLFQQVFAVLVTAHYQTSPNDISLLLDNETAHLFIAQLNDDIVGVAVLLEEGSNNEEDIQAISLNQRRLKNQFIPQSLLTHCGFNESFNYKYLRVLRIAIHPQFHGCGFGERFMLQLKMFAQQQKVDFIGASFGANAQLVKFWQNTGFQIARIGFTKDKASGENSVLVIAAMSDRGQFFERKIINEFYNSFDYLLTDEYKTLDAKLVWQILHQCPRHSLPQLTTHQLDSISDFLNKKRQFSHCVKALHFWCLLHCKESYQPQVKMLIERILQKKSVETVCIEYQLTGKKMLNNTLIDYISKNQ